MLNRCSAGPCGIDGSGRRRAPPCFASSFSVQLVVGAWVGPATWVAREAAMGMAGSQDLAVVATELEGSLCWSWAGRQGRKRMPCQAKDVIGEVAMDMAEAQAKANA